MKQVSIVYPAIFRINSLKVAVPEKWEELSPAQYLAVTRYFLGDMAELDFFRSLIPIPKRILLKMDDFHVHKLADLLDFLNAESDLRLDHFILPLIKCHRETLYAPSKRLSDVSLQQFMSIDTYYGYYAITQKEQFLVQMVAAAYLPKGQSFIGEHVVDMPANILQVTHLPTYYLYAVFQNWTFIKSWLGKVYPYLFPPGHSTDQDDKRKPQPPDWLTLFDTFVGEHVADMPAYQAMPCMDAFRIINRKIKEASR